MAFYSYDDLLALGFINVSRTALISTRASFYGTQRISLGEHCRIDDFCVLSAGEGGIEIGRNVHVAVMCTLIGKGKMVLSDFSNISGRVSIYSSNDDYGGACLAGAMLPEELRNVDHRGVTLGRHAIVGAGSVVLPGVHIGDGAAVGAMSLVKESLDAFGIYVGCPARKVGERERALLMAEQRYLQSISDG